MFTKLLIKLGLKKDPKAIVESLLKELDAIESVKVIPAQKKPVKKAPVKKKAAPKKKAK
jgi:hypothetical protein